MDPKAPVKGAGPVVAERRARLTRDESRAVTRARLVLAATEVFAERGFYGTSVEEIAARAGYTRGAFYSNFDDKEEAYLAVLDQRSDQQIAEITELVKGASSADELFTNLRRRHDRRPDDPTWVALGLEFRLHAIREPSVRARLVQRERLIRRAYGRAISAQFKALGIRAPAPLDHLGAVIEALDHGLALQHRLDPDGIPEHLFYDVLDLLLRAVAALGNAERM